MDQVAEVRLCACGCGGELPPRTSRHRRPPYLRGHREKTPRGGFAAWAAMERGRQICACGCGEFFEPTREHWWLGFPACKRGHAVTARKLWLAQMAATSIVCACGCGKQIQVKTWHHHRGVPRFLVGHAARVSNPRYKGVDKWVAENTGKHLCACGCGLPVRVSPKDHSRGLHKYIYGHHPTPRMSGENSPRYVRNRSLVRNPNGFGQDVRREALERVGHCCSRCGFADRRALEVDHIIPVRLGGTPVPENAQVLCANCHCIKTAAEREAIASRPRRRRP